MLLVPCLSLALTGWPGAPAVTTSWSAARAGVDSEPRMTVRAGVDSAPFLTVDALTRMTTFWRRFSQAPAPVQSARHQKVNWEYIIVTVRQQHAQILLEDMNALAHQYPAVAAALQAVGLTAPQWEAYRIALYSAVLTRQVDETAGHMAPVLQRNVAFLNAHPQAFDALLAAGMWVPKTGGQYR
jgi:hypothetical protein